jgi:hypothetical protein
MTPIEQLVLACDEGLAASMALRSAPLRVPSRKPPRIRYVETYPHQGDSVRIDVAVGSEGESYSFLFRLATPKDVFPEYMIMREGYGGMDALRDYWRVPGIVYDLAFTAAQTALGISNANIWD